jgi:asparagine synthase (glutamine-hydrolysing)
MPGIVGLITARPRLEAEIELKQMVNALHHESFYRTGTWACEELGVYVGWVALENSFCERMPLLNEDGKVALIFSGEEFPDPALVHDLKRRGHIVDAGHASHLVHSYEEDAFFPAGLNGRFQGLIVDRNRKTVMLFNDRYGMNRVYYHERPDTFYFAPEAKAILAARPELRTIIPQSLGELVACGCVLENRTLFQGINVLPPASAWLLGKGRTEQKRSYFEPEQWEQQAALEPDDYYEELRNVFAQTLPRYFGAAERVAMSLTGGLDTRMIMAWHKEMPGSLPCFSFGGSYRDCQDVLIARQIAAQCQQQHSVIPVGGDFLSRFAHYAERTVYLTDGCADVSRSPDLYATQKARQFAPVRMTGNYGGEVLRRVRAFKPVEPASGLFRTELLDQVKLARQAYSRVIGGHPLSFAVFRQAPWHHYGLYALEQTQLYSRSPYLDNAFVRTVFRAPASASENNDVCLRLIGDGNSALRNLRTDRGLAGNGNRLIAGAKRQLLEFTFKAEYAYDYGMPQWVARVDHVLSPLHLERMFLGRHKFYHFRVWYRDALAAYLREILLDRSAMSRPYVQPKVLESIVNRHVNGERNYTTEIHKLLSLELIHRQLVDKAPVTKSIGAGC